MAEDDGYTINTNGRLQRLIELVAGHPPTLEKMFRAFDKVYRGFIRARWRKFSRGGGNWKKLAASTIARKKHELILLDTNLAYKSVDPEFLQTFQIKPGTRTIFQASVAFASNAVYPTGISVDEVMSYHQEGTERMPQRKVLVSPDYITRQTMAKRGEKVLTEFLKKRG